jgi:predicted DsbA family dithiol-disulfide isomerase
MKLEVNIDVVCPWSYLGKRWLETALEKFEGRAEVQVEWRSLVLDAPQKGDLDREDDADLDGHLTELAAAEGLTITLDPAHEPDTLAAHRLLYRAAERPGEQSRLLDALFAAHFADGADLGDPAVLAALAEAAGVSGAAEYLASDDGLEAVKEEIGETRAIGFTSTPTFVFEERWAIEGAQPADVLLELLAQVADKSIEARAGGEGGGCCGGGCCG